MASSIGGRWDCTLWQGALECGLRVRKWNVNCELAPGQWNSSQIQEISYPNTCTNLPVLTEACFWEGQYAPPPSGKNEQLHQSQTVYLAQIHSQFRKAVKKDVRHLKDRAAGWMTCYLLFCCLLRFANYVLVSVPRYNFCPIIIYSSHLIFWLASRYKEVKKTWQLERWVILYSRSPCICCTRILPGAVIKELVSTGFTLAFLIDCHSLECVLASAELIPGSFRFRCHFLLF